MAEWKQMTLSQVAKWGSGGTPKAKRADFYGGEIPWAVIGDLNDGVVTETQKNITELGLQESSAKWIPQGAILIAMYGSIGKLGIAGIRMTSNQAIAFAIPDESVVLQKYLFYYLMSQRSALLMKGKGATQQNISQTILKAWPIPVPSLQVQSQLVDNLESQLEGLEDILSAIDLVQSESKSLRAALMFHAFNPGSSE